MRPNTVQWRSADGRSYLKPDPSLDPLTPGGVDIIDQTLLPGSLKRITLSTPETIYDAIQRLAVRGAPAIGCAAALGLAACAQRFGTEDCAEFLRKLRQTAEYLESSRPTAVNLSWALRRCCGRTVSAQEKTVAGLLKILLTEALEILDEDIAMCSAIGQNGRTLIRDGMGILTHCNAGALATGGCGTALAPIYAAQEAGLRIRVYSDETRPLLQGARLTAWELSYSGIDVTTICDSMAAQVMREGRVDLVIVGADRVAANGDAANKIGTYQLAIAANYHHIPFYVAIPSSTIDRAAPDGSAIPIEQRHESEITTINGLRISPQKIKVYNPAFDVTPASLITGYITEKGVCSSI